MVNEAQKLLESNFALYSDMLDCIERREAEIIFADSEVVLLLHVRSDIYMLAPFARVGLLRAVEYLGNVEKRTVVLHGEEYFAEYKALVGAVHDVPCYQATFPVRQGTEGLREDVVIRPLGTEWTDFVTKHYSRSGGRSEYCYDRLKSGAMFGAFIDGEIVGFIGQHDENSIGLLEVLPAFSGKGVGKKLEAFMINRILDEGHTPYCHVIVGEEKAYNFHMKKEGVIMSTDKLTWTF